MRELSLLVGVLLLSAGQPAEAATQLASQRPPPGLGALHAWYLGEAQFYSRDYTAAAKSFTRAQEGAPAWLARRIEPRLGEAWLRARRVDKALPLLEAAGESGTPEGLFQRAEARLLAGKVPEALEDLRALAVGFPADALGVEGLSRLGALSPSLRLSSSERLTRARLLLDAQDAVAAWAELEQAEAETPGATHGPAVELLRAQVLFARGDEVGANACLEAAARGPAATQLQVMMVRARRAMRAQDHRGAHELFSQVDARFPGEPEAEEAGYLAAWLDLQDDRLDEAVAEFERFDVRHAASRRRDEALWFRSLALVRLARYPEARRTLERLVSQFPRTSLVPQALYWSTRCLQLEAAAKDGVTPKHGASHDAGFSADAGSGLGSSNAGVRARSDVVADYAQLIERFPGSVYAVLARERLLELGQAPPTPFTEPPRTMAQSLPANLRLAAQLASMGLYRDSAQEVALRMGAVSSTAEALRYGQALQSFGDYGSAYVLAARWLWGAAFSARSPEALALFYPRAFAAAVEEHSLAVGLDTAMAWSIMRRESAFRPEVTSIADARGLMQLIPPTAEGIAHALSEPAPPREQLYEPELNIRYATWYLAALQRRFGHLSLAAAAYNGGPAAVARWATARGDLPLDLWMELIPYKETRGYVKQVTADFFIYHALYDSSAALPRLSLTVPAPGAEGPQF